MVPGVTVATHSAAGWPSGEQLAWPGCPDRSSANTVALLCSPQGGPLGVLPGHLADHLQRAGAPPGPDEGEPALAGVRGERGTRAAFAAARGHQTSKYGLDRLSEVGKFSRRGAKKNRRKSPSKARPER